MGYSAVFCGGGGSFHGDDRRMKYYMKLLFGKSSVFELKLFHAELLGKDGIYAKMWQAQSGLYQ